MVWIVGLAVFLVLFFIFPRQMAALCAVALLIVAVGAAYIWNNKRASDKEQKSVYISAAYDKIRCVDPQYPVVISITNAAKRTLYNVSFYIKGHRKNFSDDTYSFIYESARIIEPSATYAACYSLTDWGWKNKAYAPMPEELEWTASSFVAEFRD